MDHLIPEHEHWTLNVDGTILSILVAQLGLTLRRQRGLFVKLPHTDQNPTFDEN